MARLTLTVSADQEGRTVRSLLKGELGLSTGLVNRLKRREEGLTLNGSRVFTSAVVHAGDVLAAEVTAAEEPAGVAPAAMDLDIYFEDEHLLILNKPAPLAVIPSSFAPEEVTLASGMAHYLGPEAGYHPVNRLDRGTTGLMIVAKSGYIHECLRRSLHSGDFYRRYQAICVGAPPEEEGVCALPIGRDTASAIKRCIDPRGQSALTEYRVTQRRGDFSLVELTPHTGRTHQLRVHMAALGCPLAGDWLYGEEDRELIARPALHAAFLAVTHPVTGEKLAFTAPLPDDMKNVLEYASCHS